MHGTGAKWVSLFSADGFQETFGHPLDNSVFIGVMNGDARQAHSEDTITARVVPGDRVDVLFSSAVAASDVYRLTYIVVISG